MVIPIKLQERALQPVKDFESKTSRLIEWNRPVQQNLFQLQQGCSDNVCVTLPNPLDQLFPDGHQLQRRRATAVGKSPFVHDFVEAMTIHISGLTDAI